MRAIKELATGINNAAKTAQCRVETIYQTSKDEISNHIDDGVSAAQKVYIGAKGVVDTWVTAGVTISLVVAPVPTVIGLAMMWLINLSVEAAKSEIDNKSNIKKRQREIKRLTGILKKFGSIPQTAYIETRYVKIKLDATTNNIEGTILAGEFTGVGLNNIDCDQLDQLIQSCPCADTRDVLLGFKKFQAMN